MKACVAEGEAVALGLENSATTLPFVLIYKVRCKSCDFNFLNRAARTTLAMLANMYSASIQRLTIVDHVVAFVVHPDLSRLGGVAISIADAGLLSNPFCDLMGAATTMAYSSPSLARYFL